VRLLRIPERTDQEIAIDLRVVGGYSLEQLVDEVLMFLS